MTEDEINKKVINIFNRHKNDLPQENDEKIKFETHIIDFCGNLYGREIEVMFHAKMRDIISFENIDSDVVIIIMIFTFFRIADKRSRGSGKI